MFKSKLRLQIRIDDFRELQDKRNLSSKEQNEKLALDSLDFYTYTTKVLILYYLTKALNDLVFFNLVLIKLILSLLRFF